MCPRTPVPVPGGYAAPWEEVPPVLIRGGRCWVVEEGQPPRFEEALLLAEGRIAAVGSDEEIRSHPAAAGAQSLDLQGQTVLPGLTDAHAHAHYTAQNRRTLDLSACVSLEAALELLRRTAAETPRDQWIHGTGFCDARWSENRVPTRQDLDDLGIPQPVLLIRSCVHVRVGNGEALRRAGLPHGPEASGVLKENEAGPVVRAFNLWVRESGAEEQALEEQLRDWASYGVTEVHTCGAEDVGVSEDLLAYQKLRARGALPLRVLLYSDREPALGMASGFGDRWIRYGGFKFFLDGSLGGRTAALSSPYADDPSTRGQICWEDEPLFEKALGLHLRGVQIQVHTIGDEALDQMIRLLEHLEAAGPHPLGFRHRVNHVMFCRDDQMERLAALDPVLDIQPAFVPSDLPMLEDRVGPDRLDWSYRWGDFVRRGFVVTGSSDSPVEPPSPFRGIWGALARTTLQGTPEGGFTPHQRLNLHEALGLFTHGPAEAAGERRGRLLPGWTADVAVCDRDLFSASPEEIRDTRASAVFAGGRRIL